MTAERPAAGPAGAPDAPAALRILALLREDRVDAAIDAGLARFQALPALDATANHVLLAARDRLLAAWAARERYRARNARLERLAAERQRARAPQAALPAAAAAALARARARAAAGKP